MADNYLERRMEDLRSGRIGASARRHTAMSAKNPHTLTVTFPEMRILVADGLSELGKAIVKAFRSVGMKVAFCAPEQREGNLFAQESGARYCPVAEMDQALPGLEKAWGGIDLWVVAGHDGEKVVYREARDGLPPALSVNPELFPDTTHESLARMVLLLAHPSFRQLCRL